MSHKATEGYSGKNPVPKVALKSILDPSGATEAKAKRLVGDGKKDEQKRQNATQRTARQMAKGKEVRVRDPVTGEETNVKHGGDEHDSDDHGKNVLSMDYPPPDWTAHRAHVLEFAKSAIVKTTVAYVVFPLLIYFVSSIPVPFLHRTHSFSESYPHISTLIFLIISLSPPTAFAYTMLFALHNQSAEDFTDRAWDSERTRGLASGEDVDGDGTINCEERVRESAEWLNAVLRGVWPIINPDLFNSAVDMLEDIMQASVPKFIHSVRVADLGQGSNALRVTSVRSLPDGDLDDALQGADDSVKEHLKRDHVNVEISFAYRALPSGSTANSKAHNAHLLIEFFLGLSGVYEFKLPVWVELTGVSGTARARLELIPDPPFIKTTLLTLMGLPRVSIAVVPMSKSLPNVMNIPVLSSFISESIDAACAEYVAPRSLTLDLQQLISSDDIKKDTEAVGVIVIHIHRAMEIKKMDTRNSSDAESADPYVTVTYSRQGKPLYSTRIIFADLNPIFEETAAITVDANAIKIGEKLSLQLWDSDRASADDMMGFVEIDILELMRNKNTPHRRISELSSPDSESRSGSLEYTVGYYSKMAPNGKLETDGSDPAIPEDLKQHDPDFREARAIALNDLEAAVLVTPPDPDWPSGILSVQIHEIRELKVRMEGREKSLLGEGRKEGDKGQDDDGGEQEEGSDLPSSYCTIALNDELVYSTRVKPITATPTFNAGTERFVRDWRSAHASVVVRDSRMREDDPILGIIFLKLSDLLVNASEVTRFFPLENGIGYGSARISVLFRPVRATLPPALLGFETGTLIVRKIGVKSHGPDGERLISSLQSCEVRLKTSASTDKISRKAAERSEDGSIVWHEKDIAQLPVRQRYSTALIITFKEAGVLKSGKQGMAVVWLRDIVDGEDGTIDVTLFKADDYSRLKQNYVTLDGKLDMWDNDSDRNKLTRIGIVQLDMTFQPGITPAHKNAMNTHDPAQKRVWDEVDRRDTAGLTDKVGEQGGEDGKATSGENTEVDKGNVEIEKHENGDADHPAKMDGDSGGSNDDNEGRGLMKKLRDWKQHEKELHRQHRGAMQVKPARTAEWLKDNLEEAGEKVKDRFKMKPRQPDIETEV